MLWIFTADTKIKLHNTFTKQGEVERLEHATIECANSKK